MALVVKNKYAGESTVEFTAGANLIKGNPLVINTDGKVIPLSGTYSPEPRFYGASYSQSLTAKWDDFVSCVVNEYLVKVGYNRADDKVYGLVGKINSDTSITWGEVTQLYSGSNYQAFKIVAIPTSNKCVLAFTGETVSGTSIATLYLSVLNIDADKMTLSMTHPANAGAAQPGGYDLLHHPVQDILVVTRSSSSVMYSTSYNISSSSLSQIAATTFPSSYHSPAIRTVYCKDVDRVLTVFSHTSDSNRLYYLIFAVTSGVPAVIKTPARISSRSQSLKSLSYNSVDNRVLMFGSAGAHVMEVTATSATIGAETVLTNHGSFYGGEYDPVHNAYMLCKYNSGRLEVFRVTSDPADNTMALSSSTDQRKLQGYVFCYYSEKLKVFLLVNKVSTERFEVNYALPAVANSLDTPLIGFCSDDTLADNAIDIIPIHDSTHIVEVSKTLTPTDTYFVGYDGSLKEKNELTFVDGLVNVSGFAISTNELVINK